MKYIDVESPSSPAKTKNKMIPTGPLLEPPRVSGIIITNTENTHPKIPVIIRMHNFNNPSPSLFAVMPKHIRSL